MSKRKTLSRNLIGNLLGLKIKITMTLKELKSKVRITHAKKYGSYNVEITFYGKTYHCTSNNFWAYERAIDPKKADKCYTQKQAYQELYDECLRKNKIGKFAPKDYCVITIYK